jgi:hypothetical protein
MTQAAVVSQGKRIRRTEVRQRPRLFLKGKGYAGLWSDKGRGCFSREKDTQDRGKTKAAFVDHREKGTYD